MSLKFDYLHIVFTYDDPLSVRGTKIANRENIFGNRLYLGSIVYCFLLCEVTKDVYVYD